MKNVLIIIFSLLIISTVVYFFYLSFSFGVFPSDDGFNSDEIIVVDSVQITSNKVYWFCNKADCGTSSMGWLSYCKSAKLISDENVFFVSSYITSLDYDSDRNLLLVELYNDPNGSETDSRVMNEGLLDFEISFKRDGDIKRSLDFRLREKENY